MIKKILIANRGEIALRIMRTAKEMGIQTIAVFSEADRRSLHVQYADEAVCIGPAPSSQSYLKGEKLIEVCKQLKGDAIHPGYGFLSENANFARAVISNGLVFIGPTPSAMEMMGNKISAKNAAIQYKVPTVPGTSEPVSTISSAKKIASKIGFPILIKASAGGGGKGMRIVQNENEFESLIERAMSEALLSFGDSSVFIEKYLTAPRHIEFQILADTFGNVVYLFERECSIQRRHQKLVEEAPSCILDTALRTEMGNCAVSIAKACNYSGAGTIEFLLDEKRNFYFLEMNTRLQVEHPVTELITGIDLVREQIHIAQNEKLRFKQEDILCKGHAIELRVNAENPYDNFLPDTGILTRYERPAGPGVRVDDGYKEGMEIPVYYDPMIAKLVVHAETRILAIEKMKRAISDFQISGIKTTLPFGKFVCEHTAFIEGNFDTGFVEKHFKPEYLKETIDSEEEMVGLCVINEIFSNEPSKIKINEGKSSGSNLGAWRRRREREA